MLKQIKTVYLSMKKRVLVPNESYPYFTKNTYLVVCVKDEVPAALMDAHIKNVEASTTDGKYDPAAGLIQVP